MLNQNIIRKYRHYYKKCIYHKLNKLIYLIQRYKKSKKKKIKILY
jgi:hypothetical protein